jgi:hypothetical protein
MLQKLSEQVAFCHKRASESRARADNASTQIDRLQYLDIERQWMLLARSYEISERVALFTDEVRGRHPSIGLKPSRSAPSSARDLAAFLGVDLGDSDPLRRDGLRLVKAFMAICNPETRAKLVGLAELAVRKSVLTTQLPGSMRIAKHQQLLPCHSQQEHKGWQP